MTNEHINRRSFLKTVGLTGAALTAAGASWAVEGKPTAAPAPSAPAAAGASMPTRPFGRSGIQVPILGIGGMFDIPNNQIVLHQALAQGVTYWDTADCYEGGKSEEGIGLFFDRNPDARKRVFLVTKSDRRDVAGMSDLLARSLTRMKTDRIDLYFLHGVGNISDLNEDIRKWAEARKAEGKIGLFGFSTHKNMAACMSGAAKLGWVDGIMPKYDYRLMQDDAMRAAVDECVKAGIGLTAMKTQGGRVNKGDTSPESVLVQGFLDKGFTDKQANLKAVWSDTRIASICSQMPNLTILRANVAAALDRTELAADDHAALRAYADATGDSYCAGCGAICESAADGAPVSDVMRCLMYAREYGDHTLARHTFQRLSGVPAGGWATADLSAAEGLCPQRLPLARLVREASELLG